MTVTLWHIELSHYAEKARWALDYKGVPHTRKAPLPGTHRPVALTLTRGKHDRLPVIEIDGRRIGDSTAIIAALEAAHPSPPLYPADPGQLRRALELEDFFDENLGAEVRRLGWFYRLQSPDEVVGALMPGAGATRRRVMKAMVPMAAPVIRRDYGVSADRAEQARGAIRAAMDRLESELQPSGYLVGEAFSVADLTAASLFTPLLLPPERPYPPAGSPAELAPFCEELEERPGGQWVAEMYARHRGHSSELART